MKYLVAVLLFAVSFASLWFGAWAAHVYEGQWQAFPTLMTSVLLFVGGFIGGMFVLENV